MRFLQSFWSKPFLDEKRRNDWNYRYFGGFPNTFLFYCSWTYSCLSIQRHYPNLHIVTDDHGIRLFRDVLELPYATFSNALNDLADYHTGAWALGKLYTYRLQKGPFCHLDGDVFLFGPVLDSLLTAPLFCQSYQYDPKQYEEIHPYVHQNFRDVPPEFEAQLSNTMKFVNVGIIGGNHIDLFQKYTSVAFSLLDENQDKLDTINSGLLNLYYEQFLLSNMLHSENLEFKTLFPGPEDEDLYDFAAFHLVPHKCQYIHLISHLKKSTEYLEQVVARLKLEFPAYYKRLLDYCKQIKE